MAEEQQTTTWVYTPEQRELWDKHQGPGLYTCDGEAAYTYLTHRLKWHVVNADNPHTVLVIGNERDATAFFKDMEERGAIEWFAGHQEDGRFFWYEERNFDGEGIAPSLRSEMDTERFRNFIATSTEKSFNPVSAAVILEEFDGELPYVDRILEVPVYKNGHIQRVIRPEVFHVVRNAPDTFQKQCSDVASVDWRKDTSTFDELSKERPKMLIEHLIPEKALTVMAAPSYTGKTHIAIEVGLALATGSDFLGHFKGPQQPVPVIYHVPELHASLFRDFMERLGADERLKGNKEMFLTRPLERDLWSLDSPQMIDSSRGRYVFLDTFGYFNDGDDSASYNQAIEFAKKINNLIREGCLGVCGLYHPPKYSKDKKTTGNVMTLENQILGSAGYGGVLRSCLAMRNLHEDSNKGLWVYVQGVKNPGLEGPFQIEGVPLKLIRKPGESPYLSELLKDNKGRKEQALALLKEGKSRDEVCKVVGVSPNTLTKWKKEQQQEIDFNPDEVDA